ncbi:MAG: cytochrome b [Gammaproteobacteria bacterium]|nr:cytochrome b [Gammaproteobacteria bacterium]MBU1441778.1 cytochrome b [Gammaproteobacteria bacterium]MBU2410821.1 cytochrome b [Gammaproteobacteria bacterium]
MTEDRSSYRPTAKWLHWLVVLLVATQFSISFLMPDIGRNTVPGTLINLHLSFGIVILAVMAVRLVYRLGHPVPLDAADAPKWERALARATHWIFYAILLVGPFLGWASASSHRLPVVVFGMIPLPALAAPGARWANQAGDVHAFGMWVLLALVGLHAAAALYHHLVRHDDTLRRMLPAGR